MFADPFDVVLSGEVVLGEEVALVLLDEFHVFGDFGGDYWGEYYEEAFVEIGAAADEVLGDLFELHVGLDESVGTEEVVLVLEGRKRNDLPVPQQIVLALKHNIIK